MTIVGLTCPIDELPLDAAEVSNTSKKTATAQAQSTEVGKHVHLDIAAGLRCAGGHTWAISQSIIMERVE